MQLSPPLRVALFGLGLFLFHLLGNHALPLLDRDEPRFAEASREMLERRDFVVPYFNNRVRFDKPPLTYWCQAACYRVLGDNEFAARLPSAVAATLIALLLSFVGPLLQAQGWRAALIFSFSLQTLMHARAAVADMLLVLFTTIAFLTGWLLSRPATPEVSGLPQNSRRWVWIAFWSSLALGFLTKGPVALLPIGAVGIFAIWERPPGLHQRIRWGWGLLVLLSLVAVWGVPALLQTQGAFWKIGMEHHVFHRSLSALEGHGGRGWTGYLLTLPLPWLTLFASLFPWSIRIPSLVASLRHVPRWDAATRYLVGGILLTFAIFTFSATKLPHYTLPAFPLIALLLDRAWGDTAERTRRFRTWATVTGVVFSAALLIVPPRVLSLFSSEMLYRQTESWLEPEMEFASLDYQEPSLVWSFRKRVRGWHAPIKAGKLAGFMAKPGARFCILPSERVPELFPNPDPTWRQARVSGLNIPKGKAVNLTLLLKPGDIGSRHD